MTYTWRPSRDYLDHSNVARLMRTLGVTTADELRARSVADIGAFWDTVVHDLGIEFRTPYSQVVDLTRGIEYPEWFVGGTINIDAELSHSFRAEVAFGAGSVDQKHALFLGSSCRIQHRPVQSRHAHDFTAFAAGAEAAAVFCTVTFLKACRFLARRAIFDLRSR